MTKFRILRAAFAAVLVGLWANFAHAQQMTQTWLMLKESSQETFFVTDRVEQSRLLKTGWKISGTAFLHTKADPATAGMVRYSKGSDMGSDRIFAISPEQAAAAEKAGYQKEGLMGHVSPTKATSEMVPVYRYTKDSRNFWVIDQSQQAWAEKNGWKLEGVAFWLWPKTP